MNRRDFISGLTALFVVAITRPDSRALETPPHKTITVFIGGEIQNLWINDQPIRSDEFNLWGPDGEEYRVRIIGAGLINEMVLCSASDDAYIYRATNWESPLTL